MLCNQVPELHGHCVPRFEAEDPTLRLQGPFEAYDFGASPIVDSHGVDRELRNNLQTVLKRLLDERA